MVEEVRACLDFTSTLRAARGSVSLDTAAPYRRGDLQDEACRCMDDQRRYGLIPDLKPGKVQTLERELEK